MKKVNIALEDDMHTRIKIICTIKKITLSEYLRKTIEEVVEKDKILLENNGIIKNFGENKETKNEI